MIYYNEASRITTYHHEFHTDRGLSWDRAAERLRKEARWALTAYLLFQIALLVHVHCCCWGLRVCGGGRMADVHGWASAAASAIELTPASFCPPAQLAEKPNSRSGIYYRTFGAHGGGRNYVLALERNERGRRDTAQGSAPLYYRLARPMTGYGSDMFWCDDGRASSHYAAFCVHPLILPHFACTLYCVVTCPARGCRRGHSAAPLAMRQFARLRFCNMSNVHATAAATQRFSMAVAPIRASKAAMLAMALIKLMQLLLSFEPLSSSHRNLNFLLLFEFSGRTSPGTSARFRTGTPRQRRTRGAPSTTATRRSALARCTSSAAACCR